MTDWPLTLIAGGGVALSIVLHEVSHGWVANAFGDDTAKRAGRITLNPLRHIDLFGTVILPLMLVLAGRPPFGFAKPVPVNVRQLRNPRNHGLLVSLAGPVTNLILAVAATFAFKATLGGGRDLATDVLFLLAYANVVLALFNLLPIPPLDGSAVLERALPTRWWPAYLKFRGYSMGLLLGLVLLAPGVVGNVLFPAVDWWFGRFGIHFGAG